MWLHRLQCGGVVPVVEVAAITLHALQRGESQCAAVEQLRQAEIAEIVRGQVRKQAQADVGRRRAVRGLRDRLFLIVVRRQPVVVGTHEALEERPSPPRHPAHEFRLRRVERRGLATGRTRKPSFQNGRGEPEQQPWQRKRQRLRTIDRQIQADADSNRWTAPQRWQQRCPASAAATFGRMRRDPLQQMPMRNMHAPAGARDRAKAGKRIMGQASHFEQQLCRTMTQIAQRQHQVATKAQIRRFAHQRQPNVDRHWQDQDFQREEGPIKRSREYAPAEQQNRKQSSGDQTATQVVEDFPERKAR